MFTITGAKLTDNDLAYEIAQGNKLQCEGIDYASIIALQATSDKESVSLEECKCPGEVSYVVSFKPAEDILIPVTVCTVHFNAVKLALAERSIVIDLDLFEE
jgi:hypothetical protein